MARLGFRWIDQLLDYSNRFVKCSEKSAHLLGAFFARTVRSTSNKLRRNENYVTSAPCIKREKTMLLQCLFRLVTDISIHILLRYVFPKEFSRTKILRDQLSAVFPSKQFLSDLEKTQACRGAFNYRELIVTK